MDDTYSFHVLVALEFSEVCSIKQNMNGVLDGAICSIQVQWILGLSVVAKLLQLAREVD